MLYSLEARDPDLVVARSGIEVLARSVGQGHIREIKETMLRMLDMLDSEVAECSR